MTQTSEESLDDIARLLSTLVRREMDTQNEAILAFVDAGISPARTAELIGTSVATVRSAQAKAKKSPAKKDKSHA
jgi:DNA-directed RNA polymerase specialized sigma24 family protein